ncbi:MAG: Flagellar sensor histidine kinase FleS [Myxococcaceae bacterium]|nr:Flagellar sensor histidine kinase FleS [Myxococcaceae bacterium]
MLLTVPATASCIAAVMGLIFGLGTLALGLSSGPGLRALRWFGLAALCASVYAFCVVVTTLPVSLETRAVVSRIGGCVASLLVACWYAYFAAQHDRRARPWERAAITGTIVIAAAWLVPGLCRSSRIVAREVPWLGVTYTTTQPTAVGQLTYLLLFVATSTLVARYYFSWRRGEPGGLAHFLGVSVQLVAGINDALAATGRLATPYLLDMGQFVVILAVGSHLISRFVADARALERSGAELRAAQAELLRRERLAALGEISAVVAHEVRNPLAVIFNALSSLRKEKPVSEDAGALLGIVQEEADRLKRVVGDLLDFARPHELSIESVPPARLVASAAAAARESYGEIQVRIDADDDLPTIPCDEHLIRQALVNLVTNALQAPGRREPVHVRAFLKDTPPAVCFSVYDDGAGISDDVAKRLFTPFFTTRPSGTGLGLAIVKRVIEAHGGEISWHPGGDEAEGEQGVTFSFSIPLRAASSAWPFVPKRAG